MGQFDLRTHIFEKGTGKVQVHQPYRMLIRTGVGQILERPVGSGQWFYTNNEPVPEDKIPADLKPKRETIEPVQTATKAPQTAKA